MYIIVSSHGANMGYEYGATDDANARKLHHMKTHQQINAAHLDNIRPIEEMPYQVC